MSTAYGAPGERRSASAAAGAAAPRPGGRSHMVRATPARTTGCNERSIPRTSPYVRRACSDGDSRTPLAALDDCWLGVTNNTASHAARAPRRAFPQIAEKTPGITGKPCSDACSAPRWGRGCPALCALLFRRPLTRTCDRPRRRCDARSPGPRWRPGRARCARAAPARWPRSESRRRSRPSRSTAWARMPAKAVSASPGRSSGTKRLAARTMAPGMTARPLLRPGAPPAGEHPPRAGPQERLGQIAGAHASQRIAVAGADEERRRTDEHVAVDVTGEVHTEEGQRRVGYGIDEAPHEVPVFGAQPQVGTAEGDDAGGRGAPAATARRSAQAPAQNTA